MFKHSVIRRRGEEDVTIWVDNDFEEAIGPRPDSPLSERAVDQVDGDFGARNWHYNVCEKITYVGDTGPNAPCTGGLKEIQDWVHITPTRNLDAGASC